LPSRRFQTAEEFRSALKQATRAVPERTARLSVSELGRLGVARAKLPVAVSPELKTVALDKNVALKKTIALSRKLVAWKIPALAIAALIIIAVAYFAPWRFGPERLSTPSVPAVLSTPRQFEPSALQPVVPSTPPAVVIPPPEPAKAAAKRAINSERRAAANPSASSLNASPVSTPAPNAAPASAPQAAEGAAAVAPAVFPPLVFDAKALVGIGDRQTEREVNIQLADGYLAVTVAGSPNETLYRQPFKGIGSIAYSLSRHPLWLSPNGPAEAARAGRVLGIFSRSRHWVTVRSADAADPSTIVLRFENADQVGSVVRALAERTGRTAVRVLEPKEPK
jgi:hypothetical protein